MKIQQKNVTELRPSAANERLHSPEQVDQLVQSITAFGFNDPIAITSDGEIIEGVGRWMAAQKLELTRVPTICLDHLTPAQRDAYRVAHNRLPMLASWDTEKLLATIEAIRAEDLPASLLGFSDTDLARMADDMAAAALGNTAGEGEGGGISAGSGSNGEAYDYVPFNVIMRKEDRDRLYQAIIRCKHKHALEKSDEALLSIANEWLANEGE